MNIVADLAIDTVALKEAGINTIVGLVIVFVALIFISFVISLFKFVNKLDKTSVQKDDLAAQAITNATSQIAAAETQIDNFELVAIVTAAISEFEEAQGNYFKDGIVVRSIKRI